jgi:hypothetical protein
MNALCRFPHDCSKDGTNLVRIHTIGDRRVCDDAVRWMTETGMDFRSLDIEFVPQWRQRDLKRDETNAA